MLVGQVGGIWGVKVRRLPRLGENVFEIAASYFYKNQNGIPAIIAEMEQFADIKVVRFTDRVGHTVSEMEVCFQENWASVYAELA